MAYQPGAMLRRAVLLASASSQPSGESRQSIGRHLHNDRPSPSRDTGSRADVDSGEEEEDATASAVQLELVKTQCVRCMNYKALLRFLSACRRLGGSDSVRCSMKLLWHRTDVECVENIVREGLRLPDHDRVRMRNGRAWGTGIYSCHGYVAGRKYGRTALCCLGLAGRQYSTDLTHAAERAKVRATQDDFDSVETPACVVTRDPSLILALLRVEEDQVTEASLTVDAVARIICGSLPGLDWEGISTDPATTAVNGQTAWRWWSQCRTNTLDPTGAQESEGQPAVESRQQPAGRDRRSNPETQRNDERELQKLLSSWERAPSFPRGSRRIQDELSSFPEAFSVRRLGQEEVFWPECYGAYEAYELRIDLKGACTPQINCVLPKAYPCVPPCFVLTYPCVEGLPGLSQNGAVDVLGLLNLEASQWSPAFRLEAIASKLLCFLEGRGVFATPNPQPFSKAQSRVAIACYPFGDGAWPRASRA